MRSTLLSFVAAMPLIIFTSSSLAVATATVSIDKFKFELIDLDLSDGIVPQFIMSYPISDAGATACKGEHIMNQCVNSGYGLPEGYVEYHAAKAWATAENNANSEQFGVLSGANVVGEGITLNVWDEQVDWSRSYSHAYLESYDAYITPHTELIVYAELNMLANTTNDAYLYEAWGKNWYISEHASASAFARLGSGDGESFDLAIGGNAASESFTKSLRNVIRNEGEGNMSLQFDLTSNTSADSPFNVSAVPEVDGFVLMLAGLSTVLLITRPKKRQPAKQLQ